MKNKMKPLILILLVVVAVGGGYWYYPQKPGALVQLQGRLGLLSQAQAREIAMASGYLEADEISVASEISGRISRIAVEEGDAVHSGQLLVELDTALLEAEVQQVEAKIETAKAQLAKIKAGVRAE